MSQFLLIPFGIQVQKKNSKCIGYTPIQPNSRRLLPQRLWATQSRTLIRLKQWIKKMKINIHTSHPSAFISSTFIDLKEERKAVADVLRKANLNINAIDVKPAANDSSRKEIINGIRESDFIILIVGERYGSIIQEMTKSRIHSITKWEYIKAVKRFRKDALVYFKNVASNDPICYDDQISADYSQKRKLLAKFKKELSSNHSPKYFTTPNELAEEVKKALIPTYRAGVKVLINKNDILLKEIKTLKKEFLGSDPC